MDVCERHEVEKRVKKELDIERLIDCDVTHMLSKEELTEITRLEDEIKIRHTFESERLRNTHPNMQAINHYRDKVVFTKASLWSIKDTRSSIASWWGS